MKLSAFLGSSTRDVGECIIKIGGSEFSEFYPNLQNTQVKFNCKDSSEATMVFAMMRDEQGQWPLMDDPRIKTWAQIEIIVVFGDTETPFFSGYIREINTDLAEHGQVATVTVISQDIFIAMDRQSKAHKWEEGRESLDIIKEIIKPYGLTLDTSEFSTPTDNLLQNKTDYRFIRELAEKNKFECYLRDKSNGDKSLYFGPAKTTVSAADTPLLIRAGRETNCFNFNVSYDGYKPDRIRVSTAPLTGQEVDQNTIEAKIEPFTSQSANSNNRGLDAFEWCQPPGHGNNQETAEANAKGSAEKSAFKLKAIGKLDGTKYGSLLMPGTIVEVGGTGNNNGKWYVDVTTHEFSSKGYFVDFELIRNAIAGDENSSKHILAGIF